jgi:hypothetical protein
LNISSAHTPLQQQQRAPVPNAAAASSSWHRDFMTQQQQVPAQGVHQHNAFGGYNARGYGGMGMNGGMGSMNMNMNMNMASEVAQGKQRAQDQEPQYNEAAFEKAFAQAQQDMVVEENHALSDYQRQLEALEARNKARKEEMAAIYQESEEFGANRGEEVAEAKPPHGQTPFEYSMQLHELERQHKAWIATGESSGVQEDGGVRFSEDMLKTKRPGKLCFCPMTYGSS